MWSNLSPVPRQQLMKSSDVGYAAVHFSGCAPYFLLDLLQQSQLETTDLDIHVLPEAFLERVFLLLIV
jgi:hypothetical protein